MKKRLIVSACLMATMSSAVQADVKAFVSGLSTPTGIDIHPSERKLYVKNGASGRVWSVPILANGTAGSVTSVTDAFDPDRQIVFDAGGNLYGTFSFNNSGYVYHLSAAGDVRLIEVQWPDYLNTGIAIETPRLSSSKVYLSTPYNNLSVTTISSLSSSYVNPSDYSTCGHFRFLFYRQSVAGVAGTYGNSLVNINPSNGNCSNLISGLAQPNGIAEDNKNNIYVADTGAGTVIRLNAQGTTKVVASGLQSPMGLVYDFQTNRLFVSETTANRVSAIVLPPSFDAGRIGVKSGNYWYFDLNGNGEWDGCGIDGCAVFGYSSDVGVVGDWNGDGVAEIGVKRGGHWYLDWNGNDTWDTYAFDACYNFGSVSDIPIAGDWDNDGNTEIGVKRGNQWYLDWNGSGAWNGCATDACYTFGVAGDIPVIGDWNNDGFTEIGVKRGNQWYLDWNGNGTWDGCSVDVCYRFGQATDVSVVGDWDNDGQAEIGVKRGGQWYLDWNGNGVWEGCTTDRCISSFGSPTSTPVAGQWLP